MSTQVIAAVYPLSPTQEGMLYHHLTDGADKSYFEQFSLRIQGRLNITALEVSLNHVIAQNEALRTVIRWKEAEKPVQIILHRRPQKIRVVDLHLKGEELEAAIRGVREEEERIGFDLERGPLCRLTICHLSENLHEIIWSYHHIIMDGWSSGIVWREIFLAYREVLAGQSPVAQPKAGMKAYLKFLQEYDRQQADAYWRQYLEDYSQTGTLPQDQGTVGQGIQKVESSLGQVWSERLKQFCRQEKATLNLVLHLAWGLLLQRYVDTTDVVFGSTVAGRPFQLVEAQEMVGLFINTIPVRVSCQPDVQVLACLNELKRESYQRARYEFSSLVEIKAQSELGAGEQLFDHILVFEGIPLSTLGDTGLGLQLVGEDKRMRTNYDLTVMAAFQDSLQLELVYNPGRFRRETLERLSGHLWNLLRGILENPACRVVELELLDEAEKSTVLHAFNQTVEVVPAPWLVHQLVEEQVERTPHQTALYFSGQTITYDELNQRANRLAIALRERGVGPDILVGVMVERSFEMVIALLGILKAGGAYLPIDPQYPAERISYMLEDAAIRLLLSQGPVVSQIPANYQGEVGVLSEQGCVYWYSAGICNDGELAICQIQSDKSVEHPVGWDGTNLPPLNSPADMAYVIYTSGSTGRPKGVALEHRNLRNLLYFELAATRIDYSGRMLQFTSLSFDVAFQEIFTPLVAGGTVYLIPDEERKDIQVLLHFLEEQQIQIVSFPFSYLNALFEDQENVAALPASLQHIITAGEQLIITNTLREYLETRPVYLHNHYGPSETHVVTTLTLDGSMNLPSLPGIGRPVSNTVIYILDRLGRVQPLGIPGEIYIGGSNVGRGYLHRPELTAERFLSLSYREGRNYRTGDLGRWLLDGTIEFLGRLDHQVKIRGFRVEPGEVEAVLLSHPAVTQAAIVDRMGRDGRKQLVAYVVTSAKEGAEIRSYLAEHLPEYMVPSAFVFLEALPLTPSGKVNRKALPEPDEVDRASTYTPPRTERERALTQIWASVLGVERVGIHDSFYELGGHSLKATQIVSRIRKELELEVPVKTLMTAQTIAGLTAMLGDGEKASYQPIPVHPARSYDPLSHAQRRLWVIYQLEENSIAYNMPAAFRLKGELDRSAFARAFQTVIERHSILRTRFALENEEPVQVIETSYHVEMPYLEGEKLEGSALQALLNAEAAKPFDLAMPGQIRPLLIRMGTLEHIFIFTMHHIISDGWSNDVLIREIGELYQAYREGRANPLTPLQIQYRDYAYWQQERLESEEWNREKAYWLDELGGELPVFNWPADFPRPALQSFEGANFSFTLDAELTRQLTQFAEAQNVTLFMVLFAAFNALCYRYTGQEDLIIGTPVAGRQHPDLEGLIGFFVNTLALRTRLTGTYSFVGLVQQVKEVAMNGFAHQEYPFDLLVEQLNVERDLSRSPVFDTMFNWLNTGDGSSELALPGLTIEPVVQEVQTSRFDLLMTLRESQGIIYGNIEYGTALFKPGTIARLVAHFSRILTAVVANPGVQLDAIQLLSPAERHQLVYGFNAVQKPLTVGTGLCVQQLVEAQVKRTPDKVALYFEGKTLTYRELNQQANRLARLLRAKGVRPDTLVGIMVERSFQMVTGLLGILKAGGAYLPLDPLYPQERIRYMLQDAAAPLLLTEAELIDNISLEYQGEVLDLNLWLEFLEGRAAYPALQEIAMTTQPAAKQENPCARALQDVLIDIVNIGSNLEIVNTPHDLVYVIYTSGSTGRPKGVQLEHRNLVNLLDFSLHQTGIDYSGRMLQFTSLSFDVSFQEIFTPLAAGGTVYLIRDDERKDVDVTLRLINEQKIEILSFPFSYLNMLFEEKANLARLPKSVQHLITAGEQLIITGPMREYLETRNVCLHNHYGPSETHVATALTLRGTEELPRLPGIGQPIQNLQIYILDQNSQPVPVGIPGEIYIGGAGVGRGYLHRPELTLERFIPDPFGATEENRVIYKTGDVGRWLADGTIEFLGRLDGQVKIRGYRVETGEVEASLLSHSKIKHATVVAKKDSGGRPYLVGYLVAEPGLTVSEIRHDLQQRLPEYMVPAAFVFLDTLPLTPSGKVDRKALPDPDTTQLIATPYRAPRNHAEDNMAQTWAEVLRVDRVGIDDHFFELGGNSLKATQLISRFAQIMDIRIPLRLFFTAPTIAEMVEQLGLGYQHTYAGIPLTERVEYYPLSHAQRRLWLINQIEENNVAYNMPAVFRVHGALCVDAFRRALQTVIDRHESLRTGFIVVEGEPVQVVEDSLPLAIPLIVWEEDEATLTEMIHHQMMQPFDLSRPGLLRATLIQRQPEEHIFVFIMHHIISDGWANEVLIRELSALYTAYSEGLENPLPPLKIQYRDYAAWQEQLLHSEVMQRQERYWLEHLQGELPVLNLPTDRKRPPVQTFRGDAVHFTLTEATSAALYRLARTQGVSLFVTLFTAYNLFLHRYSGQTDLIVGTPIAGRQHRDLEELIGFFVNTLPLRTCCTGEESFLKLLAQVKETVWNGFEHQDYPFDLLVERLHLSRDLSRSAVFDTLFSLQNDGRSTFTSGSLRFEQMDNEFKTSRYDLLLTMVEGETAIYASFNYNTGLFRRDTVERMAEHFLQLLQGLLVHPELPVYQLELMTEAERQRVIVEFNSTRRNYPREQSMQTLFEAQVASAPGQLAVILGDQALTYAQLNEESNQLAYQLRAGGVMPDQAVAVLANRSLEMIIALVGIIKAGGAFLPLDPTQPLERMELIIQDAAVAVTVVQSGLRDMLPPKYAGRVLEVLPPRQRVNVVHPQSDNAATSMNGDSHITARPTTGNLNVTAPPTTGNSHVTPSVMKPQLATLPTTEYSQTPAVLAGASAQVADASAYGNPPATASPDHLAYIMYTSGSTGKPKGVLINQYSVVKLVKANNFVEITPEDRLLQISNYTFDVSTFDIWGALLNGATLVLITEAEIFSVDALAELIERTGATVAAFPTALFHNVAELNPRLFRGLRKVVVGGERLSPVHCARVYAETGPGVLVNGYGPTETTTFATTYEVNADLVGQDSIPVGMPLANTTVYILNQWLQPQPIGVQGELYIGGDGVARGYLHRPELTAERFVENPFEPGTKLYKTGDLGKFSSEGQIEYLGRSDQQVKIRGFRVEPGEIEAALLRHPLVQEALVMARTDDEGDRYLAGYVVAEAGSDLDENELHQYLLQILPEYMVPAAWVLMPALPLTPNGKVDRRALPEPSDTGHQRNRYLAPQTPEEVQMAAIWAEVLGIERVGIRDHFFELGGYSLKATQVLSRVRREMGREIPLKLFFQLPTIEGILAALLTSERVEQRMQPQPVRDYYPLSPAQQRIWLIEQMTGENTAYNIPLAMLVYGRVDLRALQLALTQLVERHEILRTSFQEIGGEPVQIVHASSGGDVHYIDCRESKSAQPVTDRAAAVEHIVSREAQKPFDLTQPGQFRVTLAQLAEEDYLLVLTLHHIISDGWSILHIMLKELVILYEVQLTGGPMPLAESKFQYRDYALYQQEMLQEGRWAREEAYWRTQLAGSISGLNLPKDHQETSGLNGGVAYLPLTAEEMRPLRELADQTGVTLFMLMVALLSTLLHRLTQETDIVIGTPVTGRNEREVEDMLGIFLNTLLLRCDLSGNPCFTGLLARVKDVVLGAFEHQNYPYEHVLDLMSENHPTGSIARQNLFQVMINYIPDFGGKALELGNLRMEAVPLTSEAAKFELELYLQEFNGGLNLKLTYRKDLFSQAMIQQFLQYLQTIMTEVVRDPTIPLAQISMMKQGVQEQLLGDFNDDLWED